MEILDFGDFFIEEPNEGFGELFWWPWPIPSPDSCESEFFESYYE